MYQPLVFGDKGWLRKVFFFLVLVSTLTGVACSGRGAQDGELTVVSFGGAYQDAQRVAAFEPFGESTGLAVREGTYDGDYALLRERVNHGEAWDVVSVESAVCERGSREGLFYPLPSDLRPAGDYVEGTWKPSCAGHLVFSTVPAYSDSVARLLGREVTWRDFWDLNSIPGKRGLRNNPRGTLEIALLADDVPAASLYPLDVERALAKLDEIRSELVLWESGAQPIQLLASGGVVLTSAYNGRVWDAREKEQLTIDHGWTGGLLEIEYWAIPKNSQQKEGAAKFIAFAMRPDTQASFTNTIAYAPTNLAALPLVKEEVWKALPNSTASRLSQQVLVDSAWWADNEEQVAARWESWRNQ